MSINKRDKIKGGLIAIFGLLGLLLMVGTIALNTHFSVDKRYDNDTIITQNHFDLNYHEDGVIDNSYASENADTIVDNSSSKNKDIVESIQQSDNNYTPSNQQIPDGILFGNTTLAKSGDGTDFEVDYVPIEDVQVVATTQELTVGQRIDLGVKLTPSYAIQTVQNIRYETIGGAFLCDITNGTLIVKDNANIGGAITVVAIADGVQSSNVLRFVIVEIPVQQVSIDNNQTSIRQGETLQLKTTVLPSNATNKQLYYSIVDGASYATINSDGVVRINGNLPLGDLSIVVKATSISDPDKYDIMSYELYVPTRLLNLSVDNATPKPNQTIEIKPIISDNATVTIPKYTIKSGVNFVKSQDGNSITIASNITTSNPKIVLFGTRDNIQSPDFVIDIYIPTTSIQLFADKQIIKQGEMVKLNVATKPTNATLTNLKFYLDKSSEQYATIDSNGILTALDRPDVDSVDIKVYAKIDDVLSQEYIITIQKPTVILTADNNNPSSSDKSGQTVRLTVTKDGVVWQGAVFKIRSGAEFIDGEIINGMFVVSKGITAYNPKIVLYATVGAFDTGDIIINIRILAQRIDIENANITTLATKIPISFAGTIYPQNATSFNEQLIYSLNVSNDIATIDVYGQLYIFPQAQVGQIIIITIQGPDGVIYKHTITVQVVYATSLAIDSITKQDGTELTSNHLARPNDVLQFNVSFPTPFNVSQSQMEYGLQLYSGDIEYATIVGNTLTINSLTTKNNPIFVVRVLSNQNGNIIYQDYEIVVYIPVERIQLTQKISQVTEGVRIPLSSLFATNIYPTNSNIRIAQYNIIGDSEYAWIDGTDLVVGNYIPFGDLTIVIEAYAEGIYSNQLTYRIYVPTRSLEVKADNYAPISKIASGTTIKLTAYVDNNATIQNPIITILVGAELIQGNYKNGDTLPMSFSIKPNLTQYLRDTGIANLIKLVAVQDGVTCVVDDIIPYVPVESLSLGIPISLARNEIFVFNPIYNNIENAFVSVPGYTVNTNLANATINGNVLTVAQKVVAGTIVKVQYTSNDNNQLFTQQFSIAQLTNDVDSNFGTGFEASPTNAKGFALVYGRAMKSGSTLDNVAISKARMQVIEGGYTDIKIQYNGQSLTSYGITNYDIAMLSGSGTVSKLVNEYVRVSIASGASGLSQVKFVVTVYEGDVVYKLPEQTINVFKKYTSAYISQGTIRTATAQLTVEFGYNVSPVDNLKFDTAINGSGLTLTEKGQLTVTNKYATYNPIVRYTAKQYYNDSNATELNIAVSENLDIARIVLDNRGGSGKSYIVAISSLNKSVDVPTRIGYTFLGYFPTPTGGTQWYDGDGNCNGAIINPPSIFYALWRPITYTVISEHYIDGNYKGEFWRNTETYDYSYTVTATPGTDSEFLYRIIKGGVYNNVYFYENPFTYSNLTTKNNDTIYIQVHFKDTSCVVEGTLITLADGSQIAVEQLQGDELLLVWNLFTGTYDVAPIMFVERGKPQEYEIVELQFSDGTIVKIIDEHAFWSFEYNQYIFLDSNASQYIGNWFMQFNINGTYNKVQLVGVQVYNEINTAYSPVTEGHLSYFVNGLLSMPGNTQGLINIFDVNPDALKINQQAFQADIARYGLFEYADFQELLPEFVFDAFQLKYLKVSLGKELITWERVYSLIEQYSQFWSDETEQSTSSNTTKNINKYLWQTDNLITMGNLERYYFESI